MPIKEITSHADWRASYDVMRELRPHLSLEAYLTLLEEMRSQGYRLLALTDETDKMMALAGFTIQTNFYHHRHLFLYDLVTQSEQRSRGCGKELLSHLERWAKEEGCQYLELTSGLIRKDAHRFYEEKMGYTWTSKVFVKEL
ncbi:GNAT family N-acetyltransferase [Mechercharimyces sp. CAU 1602]|uniref:GNAT family N-acetyltransferase n=1 Tax=Mechercharimyces sp. CAU 1602 TaxID=2973933 RepID=UPI0021613190|nr:GNAT family N-acetyltransferase [Mechercharimyces sp. CAU 1602]MCS1350525.1 GNAT family N-acetyltransferase [Mechercharimyces sp. CAU 1602]